MFYTGVIIEESLQDSSMLANIKIISTKVEQVVEEHQTPWLKQWTLHKVEIPEEKADEIADQISNVLDYSHGSNWYADFKNDKYHFIIFRNKVFKIDRQNFQQYKEAEEYGISLGIPPYQVDFTNNRPETTLFMLMSVDGKISTGDTDERDFDKDLPKIEGLREGLFQYYDLEQKTDLYSLNTGKVMAKIGVNDTSEEPEKLPVNFIIIDNSHLTEKGVHYLSKKVSHLFIVTANENHPANKIKSDNLELINYEKEIDFKNMFFKFKNEYGVDRITIQSGGSMNNIFLRQGLIDHISVIVAPCLVGGKDTPTLIDGESIHSQDELLKIKPLKFISADILKDSYINLKYDVQN